MELGSTFFRNDCGNDGTLQMREWNSVRLFAVKRSYYNNIDVGAITEYRKNHENLQQKYKLGIFLGEMIREEAP